MKERIKIGIIGYGNLGRGVELSIQQQEDMELVAIFSRRGPEGIDSSDSGIIKESTSHILNYIEKIDVMILCGGSANDLPEQTPYYTQWFNTVDSFDNHSRIPEHFEKVNQVAKKNKRVSIISSGWDPGLFSLHRVYSEAFLPHGNTYTFWGKGLSQGHSDALRKVEGVIDGVQYTIPSSQAIEQVRAGQAPELTTSQKHRRECYVVADKEADREKIVQTIKTMPAYFADYETEVHFIDKISLEKEHSAMPHGGVVLRSGVTGDNHNQLYEFKLDLESNPEFTANVLSASARAVYRLHQEKLSGAFTVLDIPPKCFSLYSNSTLRAKHL